MRDYNAAYKAKHGQSWKVDYTRRKSPPPACGRCGEPVVGAVKDSPFHNQCWHADRARKRRLEAASRRLKAAASGVPANPRWPFVNGECLWCGEKFTRRGSASGFCSKGCSRQSKRKWITKRDRKAIYERDGWTCQICFEPVAAGATDEWRPTLDHIIPRSKGGPDDPANLRLAHMWCNAVRGDLSHYSDEDLRAAT